MADKVRQAVEAGEYASTSKVVRDALRLWQSRRELRERDVEFLRERCNDGKSSATAGPLDAKRLFAGERGKTDDQDASCDRDPGGDTPLAELYARAFSEFGSRALWNMTKFEVPTPEDVLAAARQLRREGGLPARRLAEQMEKALNAHP